MAEEQRHWPTDDQAAEKRELLVDAALGPKTDNWKHRSQGMKCSTCMWYVAKDTLGTGPDRVVGRCRRRAPTMNGFPVMYATDWCGDHKLDEEKA